MTSTTFVAIRDGKQIGKRTSKTMQYQYAIAVKKTSGDWVVVSWSQTLANAEKAAKQSGGEVVPAVVLKSKERVYWESVRDTLREEAASKTKATTPSGESVCDTCGSETTATVSRSGDVNVYCPTCFDEDAR